jgi:hypothetical protein
MTGLITGLTPTSRIFVIKTSSNDGVSAREDFGVKSRLLARNRCIPCTLVKKRTWINMVCVLYDTLENWRDRD